MIDTSKPVPSSDLRPYWVCHFKFHDGPITGLVEIEGQHYWAEYEGRTDRRGHYCYRLTPIVLTEECREYLDDYRKSYHHAFYESGDRPSYDGRPLGWFDEKWRLRNVIRELAEKREG